MKKVFLPLFVVPSTILSRKTIFFTADEKVVVEAPRKLMQKLVALCDGTHMYEEVIQCIDKEWDGETVRGLLTALRHKKVLVDARQISEEMWKIIENP